MRGITRNKKRLAWIMILIMAFSLIPAPMHAQGVSGSNQEKTVFQGDDFQVECRIENKYMK